MAEAESRELADLAADNARLRARVAELEAERDDLLVFLRDRAIDDHRAGLTEPMDDWLDDDGPGLGDGFDSAPALAGWADDDWGARPC